MLEFAENLKKKMAVKPLMATSRPTPSSINSVPRVVIHLMRHAEVSPELLQSNNLSALRLMVEV